MTVRKRTVKISKNPVHGPRKGEYPGLPTEVANLVPIQSILFLIITCFAVVERIFEVSLVVYHRMERVVFTGPKVFVCPLDEVGPFWRLHLSIEDAVMDRAKGDSAATACAFQVAVVDVREVVAVGLGPAPAVLDDEVVVEDAVVSLQSQLEVAPVCTEV